MVTNDVSLLIILVLGVVLLFGAVRDVAKWWRAQPNSSESQFDSLVRHDMRDRVHSLELQVDALHSELRRCYQDIKDEAGKHADRIGELEREIMRVREKRMADINIIQTNASDIGQAATGSSVKQKEE
jgi:hypothetical protein